MISIQVRSEFERFGRHCQGFVRWNIHGVFFAMVFGAIMKKVRSPNLNTLISVILVLDVTMVANGWNRHRPWRVCAGLTLRHVLRKI